MKLVDSMLALHRQLAAARSVAQKANLQKQIDAIPPRGTEIDRLVYDLYGLTAEEIALVDECEKNPDFFTVAKTKCKARQSGRHAQSASD